MKLLNGDCLKLLNEIDDNSVDMILCDLPYGCTQNQWDIRLPFDILWEQYERIIKKWCDCIIWITAIYKLTGHK